MNRHHFCTRGSVWAFVAGCLFLFSNLQVVFASDRFEIEAAKWNEERNRLAVKGKGERGRTVTVVNADTLAVLGRTRVEGDEWRVRIRNPSPVPCRVRAEQSDDAVAESDVTSAPSDCDDGNATPNQLPVADAGADQTLALAAGQASVEVILDASSSSDPDGNLVSYIWTGSPDPADVVRPVLTLAEGIHTFTLVVADNTAASSAPDAVTITVVGDIAMDAVSINSTSANAPVSNASVLPQPLTGNSAYKLLGANDLGMHCADLDYQVFSILPPFNVMHAQLVRRGVGDSLPVLEDDQNIDVFYSAVSNASDPALSAPAVEPIFKTNFWADPDSDGNSLGFDTYAPLFFGLLAPSAANVPDVGLPVPDSVLLPDCLGAPESCEFGQQAMPGVSGPYVQNDRQAFDRFDTDFNFFSGVLPPPLGSLVQNVNWWAADGIPIMPVDDQGRSNAYPLLRLQAVERSSGTTLASTDVVAPVASEADCQSCHASELDCASTDLNPPLQCNGAALDRTAGWTIMTVDGDGTGETAPGDTALEVLQNTAKINILRLHDVKHGTSLDDSRPVQCSYCHYTPALDLAQLGPTDTAAGTAGPGMPGTDQTNHITMSRAMHGHHGTLPADPSQPFDPVSNNLFPDMPGPVGRSPLAANAVLGETCYQCHPGKRTQCLRGAMAAGGVVCQDCHGQARHVGEDFSGDWANNAFPAGVNLNKRVPWASEPGCQSCHTGDALNPNHPAGVPVAEDGIRLLQAYTLEPGRDAAGNADGTEVATPIVSASSRFAENESLYRISKGHGGLMCEGCHGSTHAIFPNPNPNANDNLAAGQLQGHAGTIMECDTCHDPRAFEAGGALAETLDGPHGMHPVGGTRFANGGHEDVAEDNPDACRACHGRNGEGTVLSVVAAPRQFVIEECDDGTLCPGREIENFRVTLQKGDEVSCTLCHENEL